MTNMFFYMPVHIYSENNCVKNHAEELCSFGKKALIVTGPHSAAANGSLADVTAALESHGRKWAIFNEIEENPSVETVMKAREFGIREKADFVIGIGGGSPMDASKAIALMIRNADQDASFLFDQEQKENHSALPIVCIPTTCGTGSEVTAISVLTRHDLHTKQSIAHPIFADLALIDGRYLKNAPKSVFVNTSMDTLAHLCESYINAKATDFSRMCADAGLRLWAENKPFILSLCQPGNASPASPDICLHLLNTSALGGMAIAHTGTALPHGLSYALTYNAHIPHGKACGYFLPGYLREADSKDAAHVLSLTGFTSVDDLENYYCITCGREEIPDDILECSVQDLLRNPAKMAAAPFPVDEAVLRRIVFGQA